MNELLLYDTACRALADARTLDEVKELHSKAEALRTYARMAGDKELQVNAVELRLRAERRLGEMLLSGKNTRQLGKGRPKIGGERILLREIGIDKKLSSRSQRAALQPQAAFERLLAGWRTRALSSSARAVILSAPRATPKASSGLRLPKSEVQCWSIATLRQVARALTAIAEHCGSAPGEMAVGEAVSNIKIAEFLTRAG